VGVDGVGEDDEQLRVALPAVGEQQHAHALDHGE
jgi:hypothetical protein